MNRLIASASVFLCLLLATFLLIACVRQPTRPDGSQSTWSEMAGSTVESESSGPDSSTATQPTVSDETTPGDPSADVFGNGGPVVQQGDWIYYTVSEMQALDLEWGLYRMRSDGSERTLIHEGFRIHSIHLVDGWLYFIQSTTVEDGTPISVKVQKIRTDGSSLGEVLDLAGMDINQMQIAGEWIYLGGYDEAWQPSIQRVRTDGTELESIVEGYSFEAVNQDLIFALSGQNEIVRIDLESRDTELVGPDTVAGGDFTVSDGWIYYCNESDQWSLYRIRTDGIDRQQLTDEPTFNFFLDNGKIVYQLERTEYDMDVTGGELVQIALDGSGRQLITDVSLDEAGFAYLVAALDGWLYLHEITFEEMGAETYRSRLYRIDSTVSNQQEIVAYDCIMAG